MSNDLRLIALGAKIRDMRLAKGYTQEALAAEADLDRSYYGGVERGERNVAALNLMQIARVLGVEVGDFFPPLKELRELAPTKDH